MMGVVGILLVSLVNVFSATLLMHNESYDFSRNAVSASTNAMKKQVSKLPLFTAFVPCLISVLV